jgi:hypothetical protein
MMGMPSGYEDKPLIGKDIQWDLIEQDFLRVSDLTPFATVDGKKVKSVDPSMPYALLGVDSLKLKHEAILPIAHQVDFRNVWESYQQLGDDEELLVTYYPEYKGLLRLLNKIGHLPKLAISIYPSGSLEKMRMVFDGELPPQDLPRALYRYIPLERYR